MPFTWRDNAELSAAGSLADVGSHSYDTMRWLLKQDATRVLTYADVLTPQGTMRSPSELKTLFADRGVDLDRPVVTSCGSGVTAAIISLALNIAGAKESALYDGS